MSAVFRVSPFSNSSGEAGVRGPSMHYQVALNCNPEVSCKILLRVEKDP